MKTTKFLAMKAGVVAFAISGSNAMAQHNVRDFQGAGQSEVRATASITIPLGRQRDAVASEPRVEFGIQSLQVQHRDDLESAIAGPRLDNRVVNARTTLSLTLEHNPRMLLNGQSVATFGPRLTLDDDEQDGKGNDTLLYVLGGVAIFGVASLAFAESVKDQLGVR